MIRKNFRIMMYIALLVAVLSLGYKLVVKDKDGTQLAPEPAEEAILPSERFTLDIAHTLAADAWGTCDGRCDTMRVEHLIFDGTDRIIATYEGLHDDSVQADRYEASVSYHVGTGEWKLGETDRLWKCQPGRGSQEWTDEFCL